MTLLLYTSESCTLCPKVKEFYNANGIEYTMVDPYADPTEAVKDRIRSIPSATIIRTSDGVRRTFEGAEKSIEAGKLLLEYYKKRR